MHSPDHGGRAWRIWFLPSYAMSSIGTASSSFRTSCRRDEFASLQSAMLNSELPTRSHQQGDTITRRVSIGPQMLRRFPQLSTMLDSPPWTGLMAYVASTRSKPLYYLQTILGGIAEGPADPQLELHADTFHPSLKAWYFLTDVPEDGRPLTYVAGSHRLSPERIEWEKRRSTEVLSSGDPLSRRGSLRIAPGELGDLGLPQPTLFAVPANTLVVADTCGFHARADSHRPYNDEWRYGPTAGERLSCHGRRAAFCHGVPSQPGGQSGS